MFNIGSIIDQIKQKNSAYTEVKIEGGGRHKITNEQMEQLTRVLSENSHVTELWIHALNLNRAQVETLASFLKSNKTLKKFTAISHTIHDYGTKIICEALQYNNTIEHVDLSCNDATYSGGYVKAVADMLLKNRAINSLGFGWDNITPKGVSLIIGALVKRNIPMKELGLGYSVRNEGAREVANYIKTQSSLTKLHLATNGMTGIALTYLAEAIKNHYSMQELSFSTNLSPQFTSGDIEKFIQTIEKNKSLLNVKFTKSAALTHNQSERLNNILDRNRNLNQQRQEKPFSQSRNDNDSVKKQETNPASSSSRFTSVYSYISPYAQSFGGFLYKKVFGDEQEITKEERKTKHKDSLSSSEEEEEVSNKEDKLSSLISASYIIPYKDLRFNKYSVLGQGGFGVVYKGKWQGNTVAIKQLHLKSMVHGAEKEFKLEAKIMTKLHHPNVLPLYGVCIEPGKYCMVTEYMSRGSLYDVLHSGNSLSGKQKYVIAMDITNGLYHLHNKNILHRDLKSLNILINDTGRAKIADFGLAKVKKETHTRTNLQSNQAVGTVAWMAPELFSGKKYTKPADIYSYGMILWELVSAKIPYSNFMAIGLVIEHVKQGGRERIPRKCPESYAKLIKWCWNTRPKKRPSIAQAVENLGEMEHEAPKL